MSLITKIFFSLIISVFLFFHITSLAIAEKEDERFSKITAPEVMAEIADGDMLIVNVLSKLEYKMQHIPGSVNIPLNEFGVTNKLPEDKDYPIIMYCMGHG